MTPLIKQLTAISLSLLAATAIAAPKQLITNNMTDAESNAYVAGSIPSQHPTRPHTVGKVFWTAVKMACFGHTVDGKCNALIKMETNTPTPKEVGTLVLDIASGNITPQHLNANGYTITVNGPGETTITKNN